MKKNEYLAANDVHEFAAWMSARLDDATFAHAYIVRKGNKPWACTSLFNAYENYRWTHVDLPEYGLVAGSAFASNVNVLDRLQKELRAGLAAGDTDRVLVAATAVMKWGGVVNHNVSWLNAWREDLCRIIGETRDAINAGDTDHPLFGRSELRFTSGMSKVYSLVCDDFAIYDSRVAAALCRAVVLFCRETRRNHVPAVLNFPWAAAKSSPNASNPPVRNAARDGYTFQRLVRGRSYVVWNMKASWLLAAVASHRSTQDSAFARLDSTAQRLRAMEAALFMFGYDLVDRQDRQQNGSPDPQPPVVSGGPSPYTGPTTEDGWAQCKTLARENPFEYRLALATDGIQTRNVGKNPITSFTDDELNRTLQALLGDFGDRPFPLANSVDRVPAGTERNGLGTAFWNETRRNPGDTSRLAAVLKSIEVFKPSENPSAGGMHWTLNRETLNVDESSGKVNIRPYLDAIIQGDQGDEGD
ncbi:hypothetical protein PWR66_05415 [Paraburkholderia sp. A1RO-5]|uniref:hypothetical protein n=1 Tax=Paraburkholderia sp. A1RO-5 TaxID=3028369 RepID=UPI003B79C9CF